jgi:hypothetical protein
MVLAQTTEAQMKLTIKQTDLNNRNPVARALAGGQFRKQVVRDRTRYTRKTKHRKGEPA